MLKGSWAVEQTWWRLIVRSADDWQIATPGVGPAQALTFGIARLALIAFHPFWVRQTPDASLQEHHLLVLREKHRVTWAVWKAHEGSFAQMEDDAWAAVSMGDTVTAHQLLANLSSTVWVNLSDVQSCSPLTVQKPWGKEIWYTGVEARGVCEVVTRDRVHVPLPHFELALGIARTEASSALPLLKELDPSPAPFLGELYTELHEQKAEVYVVTAIDNTLYPDGAGQVRLGFPTPWGDAERQELRRRLHTYEAARLDVDRALAQHGVDFSNAAAAHNSADSWIEHLLHARSLIDPGLVEAEQRAYSACAKLYRYAQLKCSDVVRVPTCTPHALQPGVRVVEFQTPHYERKIMSSNQKVLTQDTWNVDEALSQLDFVMATKPLREMICSFDSLFGSSDVLQLSQDPLVAFDGLFVRGLTTPSDLLQQVPPSNGSIRLEANTSLRVCMVIEGSLVCRSGDQESLIQAGEACLLPLIGCELFAPEQPIYARGKPEPAQRRTRALIGARNPF